MTCRGHVQNGAIVLDDPVKLPEGAPVAIEVGAAPATKMTADELDHLAQSIHYDYESLEKLREASKQ